MASSRPRRAEEPPGLRLYHIALVTSLDGKLHYFVVNAGVEYVIEAPNLLKYVRPDDETSQCSRTT